MRLDLGDLVDALVRRVLASAIQLGGLDDEIAPLDVDDVRDREVVSTGQRDTLS
jgi:hypothetical protein